MNRTPPAGSALLRVAGAAALSLLIPLLAPAQDVTAPALKAAFIYNFMKFTVWPAAPPPSAPFDICVLGDPDVGDALAQTVAGREFVGRRVTVSLLDVSAATKTSCQVLYISGVTAMQAAQLMAGLQDSPVLTISDVAGFTEAGGMAQFFFEGGQLRFNIDPGAVKRSRLSMSARLLALAKRLE